MPPVALDWKITSSILNGFTSSIINGLKVSQVTSIFVTVLLFIKALERMC